MQAVIEATDDELATLARDFYNDTYLMDQNACSTPQLIAWVMKEYVDASVQEQIAKVGPSGIPRSPEQSRELLEYGMLAAQDRFWQAVATEARKRYDLADIKVSEKFADLCEAVATPAHIFKMKKYADNLLYVCDVNEVTAETSEVCRGRFGLFFQMAMLDIDTLKPVLDDAKVQTVAVYGVEPSEVTDWVVDNGLYGVDRVVPFGKTLDIDVVWDGYDLIGEMSRIVAG